MGKSITYKVLEEHLVEGRLEQGESIRIKVDQVLTQDATGTMVYLEFEAIGIPRIKVPLAVSYIDHNTLQTSHLNPDDHLFLQTAAPKFGAYLSRPGNGICHQVHLERFAKPGVTILGSDSHTPTAGGMGALAIGVGGLFIAAAMAGEPYELVVPKVVKVELKGKLKRPYVQAMDVILELLRRLTVKGGVGKILEYSGEGVKDLSVTERATITNMGAELGATTSIFPSDGITKAFLEAQERGKDWKPLEADPDAEYDEVIELDLSKLEPLVAQPHMPDKVVKVKEIQGLELSQVIIGSCTNSSYVVMKTVASILKGRSVQVSVAIAPGSKQVLEMLAKDGALTDIIGAGARLLESACGPCIGMGQAPPSGGVSLRSFNRNFEGRSGTKDAKIYLASPVTCAVSAIKGKLTDPKDAGIEIPIFEEPKKFIVNDNMIIPPFPEANKAKIIKGPNIKEVPIKEPLQDEIEVSVTLKTGDNITTDDILPAGAQVLPLRSNIPAISEYVFYRLDPGFVERMKKAGKGIIVGAENYGQGSSREHAAIAPMYLGVKVVLAKSFARIHRENLINFGILPVTFENPENYGKIDEGDVLVLKNVRESIEKDMLIDVENKTKGTKFKVRYNLTPKQKEIIKAGGLLPYLRQKAMGEKT